MTTGNKNARRRGINFIFYKGDVIVHQKCAGVLALRSSYTKHCNATVTVLSVWPKTLQAKCDEKSTFSQNVNLSCKPC